MAPPITSSPKSTPAATGHKRNSRAINTPTNLPRELIDHIITLLINSHSHDPAYQWTHFRQITRFHKSQLEKHFLHFWLPKLIVTIYANMDDAISYRAKGLRKTDKHVVKFQAREGWNDLDPDQREVWPAVKWNGELRGTVIVRLGESVLNEGRKGGGIINDCVIPGLEVEVGSPVIWFNWYALFGVLFSEVMLMRKVTDIMTKKHMSTIRATKPTTRRTALISFLRTDIQFRRRDIISKYRSHRLQSPDIPFTIPAKTLEPEYKPKVPDWMSEWILELGPPGIFDIVEKEECMVFAMKGWRKWDEEEIKRLIEEDGDWKWIGYGSCTWYRRSIAARMECRGG